MATKKTNNRVNNSQTTTKVICSNCGAEIVIPANEHLVTGMAIGKNSGLGTVLLPTVDAPAGGCNCAPTVEDIIAAASSPNAIQFLTQLIDTIEDSGYIEVEGIVRRWIPSQCLRMCTSPYGFHDSLKFKGYYYSWDVLLADLKRQYKLFAERDEEGYKDRNRWYNKMVAKEMAKDYIEALENYIQTLPLKNHKGRQYVSLRVTFMNHGRGIHTDELQQFYYKLNSLVNSISNAKTPKTLYTAVEKFYKTIKGIYWYPEMSPAFMNAYKAAGAYYTIKDLILFENCLMKADSDGSTAYRPENWGKKRKFVKQEASLAALERKANDVVRSGVTSYGYELLGLLKDFLEYNNFDYEATAKGWAKQSEARKIMRQLSKNRRPRK